MTSSSVVGGPGAVGAYVSRYRHFLSLTDPRTMAPGTFFGMTLAEARNIVDGKSTVITAKDRALARRIVQASVHPDTGETILLPLRMAGFVSFGSLPVIGMLTLAGFRNNPTVGTALWQFINQSHNALFNYANRNASGEVGCTHPNIIKEAKQRFIMGYVGAVSTSMGLGLLLNKCLGRLVTPNAGAFFRTLIPFPAVMGGNIASVLLMRWHELSAGVAVTRPTGNNQESIQSREAAKRAVKDTIITRIILPIPVLLLPPLLHRGVLVRFLPTAGLPGTRANIIGMSLLSILCFAFALPAAVAMFPQEGTMKVDELEEEAREKALSLWGDSGVTPSSTVVYNKGI
ncbi:Sideroflexin-5 [Perkinsus olseni]|uniref:Sideroflexin-5 n=1 Tax=Perkinsus olseni TaxID=32597 RepID=A0A7J6NE38_PEROL|nr:Sideroflexin-5 [Perkinsus olseni]